MPVGGEQVAGIVGEQQEACADGGRREFVPGVTMKTSCFERAAKSTGDISVAVGRLGNAVASSSASSPAATLMVSPATIPDERVKVQRKAKPARVTNALTISRVQRRLSQAARTRSSRPRNATRAQMAPIARNGRKGVSAMNRTRPQTGTARVRTAGGAGRNTSAVVMTIRSVESSGMAR
jgi:hypothetical protein